MSATSRRHGHRLRKGAPKPPVPRPWLRLVRAYVSAYLGLWALIGALWGLYVDQMAWIFPGAFAFYGLFFWTLKELEGVER